MTAISFLFSPPLAVWVPRLVAPAKATGVGMRSEREQLIKSSSSRSTESQFCLPSTMISFYLKVMSYGTFASGNTMSSISMFHLLHKQGQVIPAGFYLGNQSNWLHSQRTGKGGREKRGTQERKAGSVFSWITKQWKNSNDVHYLNHLHACVPGCVVCIGREAANECSVTLLLSHSERPEYMEAVKMANTDHQILSAAASVSAVREAARERAILGRHTNLFTS